MILLAWAAMCAAFLGAVALAENFRCRIMVSKHQREWDTIKAATPEHLRRNAYDEYIDGLAEKNGFGNCYFPRY